MKKAYKVAAVLIDGKIELAFCRNEEDEFNISECSNFLEWLTDWNVLNVSVLEKHNESK